MLSIFRKKAKNISGRLDFIGFDMHNHLLPGIDDGSPDTETSVELMEGLLELGYKGFLCTPHVISSVYSNTPATIEPAYQQFRLAAELKGHHIPITFSAEYMSDYDLEKRIATEEIIPFPNNHILIEMSYAVESPNLREVIFQLQVKGLRPILAHPERYGFWFGNLNKFNELVDLGVELQMNMLSITGYYGEGVKKVAEKLLSQQLYTWLGTDLHNHRHLEALQNLAGDSRIISKLEKIKNLRNSSLASVLV